MNNQGPFVTATTLEPACAVAMLGIGIELMPEAGKENNRGIKSKTIWQQNKQVADIKGCLWEQQHRYYGMMKDKYCSYGALICIIVGVFPIYLY